MLGYLLNSLLLLVDLNFEKASPGAKIVQKVTLGKLKEKRVEFVKMKGPGVSRFF